MLSAGGHDVPVSPEPSRAARELFLSHAPPEAGPASHTYRTGTNTLRVRVPASIGLGNYSRTSLPRVSQSARRTLPYPSPGRFNPELGTRGGARRRSRRPPRLRVLPL